MMTTDSPTASAAPAAAAATPARIPKRLFYGAGMSTMLSSMAELAQRQPFHDNPAHARSRFVMGYPVPSWQRPLVWSDEQCERFIQSVYAGVYLGLFIYNDSMHSAPHIDGLLIDGQQRLSAIERYLAGELAVEGPDGLKHRWSELTAEEQAHFYRVPFGFQVVQVRDEAELRRLYNLMNFGGVGHTEEQRA
jgi:hypothetical protein